MLLDLDMGMMQAACIELENRIDDVCDVDLRGSRGLPVEAQGLRRDLRDARQLLLGDREIFPGLLVEAGLAVDQIQQVDDRFQRVVDLVGDRGSEPACRGELLGPAQRILAPLARGYFHADAQHASGATEYVLLHLTFPHYP